MKTKRLFSSLLNIGSRLTILASMLLLAFMGNVGTAAAAPPLALSTVTVTYLGGTLTYNSSTGTAVYTIVVNRTASTPANFTPSVVGLPSGVTAAFWLTPLGGALSSPVAFFGSSRTFWLALTKTAANPAAGSYPFTVRATNGATTISGAGTLNVAKANQTITFGALAAKTFGDPDFNVSATASSGLAVSFAASGACSVAGTLVHITGAGSCTITASQAGDTNYNAATNVPQTFTVAQASQTITFNALPGMAFGDPDFNVSATASSGLTVTFSASGSCTVTGTLVHLTGPGTCTITASQAGDANYLAAADVPQSFAVASNGSSTSVDLYAIAGSTSLPGLANPVPVWGYNTSNTAVTKPGGPVLEFNQGDTITITLHNSLTEPTALLLQGQNIAPDLTGAAPGGTQTYTLTLNKPGTFLYEAGLLPNAQHQVAMGLYGALIVHPSPATQAYGADTTFDSDEVLVLSELDTALNTSADPATFDLRRYSPKYYLINGKAYPDTGSISVASGNTVLLRYVNAGLQAHAMSSLGLSQTIIAQDGNPYQFPHSVVSETIATGQTLDTLVTIPATGTQFPLYDASLYLRNNTGNGTFAGLGGMMTILATGPVTSNDTTGPATSAMSMTPNPSDGTTDVTISATVSDAATGNSNVAAVEFYIDSTSGSPTAMTGSGSPTVSASGTIPVALLGMLSPGTHTIYVRGQDAAGNWGSFETAVLTIQSAAPAAGALHFSTAGTTISGPSGVGADAADIYFFDGSAFGANVIDAPAGANVDGFDWVSDTDYYMSFTGDVTLPGIVGTVQNEDVVHFNGSSWSLTFDGTANGLGTSNIDAISVVGSTLYFSTSDTALPTGVGGVGDDADIYSWNGSAFARVFDASASGWSSNNVDGFVYVDATHFYLSYSVTGTSVAGLGTVQDEDVVYYNNGVWSIYFDGTVNGLTSTSLDIDAFDIP